MDNKNIVAADFRGRRWPAWISAAAAAALLSAILLAQGPALAGWFREAYAGLPLPLRDWLWDVRRIVPWVVQTTYLNPWTYAVVFGVFLLESLIPINRQQKPWSVGMVQDLLWAHTDAFFRSVWLPLYLVWLHGVYDRHLSFLTVHLFEGFSPAVRAVIAFLIFDALNYAHHVVRHRVEFLWRFHMIHHSQREMNLFTDTRVHIVEYLAAKTVIFIPMFMLQVNVAEVFWLSLAMHWYTGVYHANLKTNYGLLKYFMVTPQSHRIHHSVEPRHYEKNFGVFLTVWDRMFGTLYAKYDEYPEETGLDDDRLPIEESIAGISVFRTYIRQLIFPFRLLLAPKSRSAS